MPLVSKSFSIDIVPGKTPPTIHVSEKDIGRLYYISIVNDGTPFSIPSGTTAKVEGTIGPYGFSENADVINNTVIVTLRSKMTAIKGKVWTKLKLSNNGDIASTCAFWLDVDKAGAIEGQYIDPDTDPDSGEDGGLSLEGFVQYNVVQNLTDAEKNQARTNIGAGKSTVTFNQLTNVLTIVDSDAGVPVAYVLAPNTAEANVQSDWNQTDSTADDFIKNKPSIGDAVLYSQQLLTDAQKRQARYNIYAGKSTVSYDQDYGTLSIETAGETAKTYLLSNFRRRTFYYNASTGNTNLVYSEIASVVQEGYDVQCKVTCGSSDFYAALRRDRSDSQAGPDMYVFDVHTYQSEDGALWWMSVRVYADDTIEFYEGDYDPKPVKYHNVALNADGSVRTAASSLVYSAIQSRLSAWQLSDYLLVTWGATRFLAKAVEDINGIKFITDCEHDAMQRHMVFTLNTSNVLTTTAIETYSLRPVVVWEVQDVSQGLLALNTNISSSLAWQLTGLDLTPFKRIKIYVKAGRKTGALAADSSITPASIIEMSLDNRAKETVTQNVFIASSVVQNPNDQNRLGIITCAVSGDKTKFAVLRATTLYGTAATSNTDAYPYVFLIEGYYD